MSVHVAPVATYVRVWAALLALLLLTLGSAHLALGAFNVVVNLGVALAKMLLVAVFFMHLRTASPLLRIFSAIGFAWLMLLLVLSLADYLARG